MVLVLNAQIKVTQTCADLIDAPNSFGGTTESASNPSINSPLMLHFGTTDWI